MTAAKQRTDHDLKQLVTDELEFTPSVTSDRIGVAVHDGVVILSGQVETYLEKQAAVRAAQRVRGVVAVADEIEVKTVWDTQQDPDIAREAGEALERSVGFPAGAIKATVHNAEVTLTGVVDWHFQRENAVEAVAGLRGVRRVHNLITLKPRPTSATKMKAKITSAIMRNAQLDANQIEVTVTGHQATLTGTVSSWAERRQAEYAAWSSVGITAVNNQIRVEV